MASPQLPERIHRDPEARREGNDVTQAAFQSPYAHLAAQYYERMIFARHELSSLFLREEEGAGRGPVQRATLGRDNYPALTHRQMFEAGMFLQQDMTMVPTGSEYAGVGGQKGLRSECRRRDGTRGLLRGESFLIKLTRFAC
jgi:hypothetical protein